MSRYRLASILVAASMLAPAAANAQIPSGPANDNRADATQVPALPFQDTVDMTLATEEPGEDQTCSQSEKSIWYSFTPATDLDIQLQATFLGPSLYGTLRTVSLWTQDTQGQLAFVTCGRPLAVALEAGTTYLIRVGSFYEERGSVRFEARRAGRITGTIRSTSLEPLSGECATIFQRSTNGDYYAAAPTARADSAGVYVSAPLFAGTYYVRFGCPFSPYLTSWYDGKTISEADPISVGYGMLRDGIDATLAKPRSIAGRVTDTNGAGQTTFCVDGFDEAGNKLPRTLTEPGGRYVLDVPAAGRYKVRFGCGDPRNAVEQWWENAPSQQAASWVEVGAEQTDGIDAAVTLQTEPTNDRFSSAMQVDVLPFSDLRYNLSASNEEAEPQPCGTTRGSVWYRLDAAEDATLVAAAAAETNFAGAVAVYTGSSLNDLEAVACDRAGELRGTAAAVFEAEAGQTYWVQSSASNSGYGYLRTTISSYSEENAYSFEPGASCLPQCPYNKTLAQHLATPSDGEQACDPSPAAPSGSYVDTEIVVPDRIEGLEPSHIRIAMSPVFDDDVFLCRVEAGPEGERLVAKAANTVLAAIYPPTCNLGCPEKLFAQVSPGERLIIRVYRFFGAGATEAKVGYAVGL